MIKLLVTLVTKILCFFGACRNNNFVSSTELDRYYGQCPNCNKRTPAWSASQVRAYCGWSQVRGYRISKLERLVNKKWGINRSTDQIMQDFAPLFFALPASAQREESRHVSGNTFREILDEIRTQGTYSRALIAAPHAAGGDLSGTYPNAFQMHTANRYASQRIGAGISLPDPSWSTTTITVTDNGQQTPSDQPLPAQRPFEMLRRAVQSDSSYAASWHDNLAMAAYDEGVERLQANRVARRIMQQIFEIETGDHLGIDFNQQGQGSKTETTERSPDAPTVWARLQGEE